MSARPVNQAVAICVMRDFVLITFRTQWKRSKIICPGTIDRRTQTKSFRMFARFQTRAFFLSLLCRQYTLAITMPDLPLELLATHANAYASANGIQVERRKKEDPTSAYFECAPMSLLPNAYPKEAFAQAKSVATAFNELVDRVSRDSEFLEQTLGGGVAEHDLFTSKILSLYKEVYGNKDSVAHTADRLGIHRSDYMLHAPGEGEAYRLKQVELNTIAASFAGLACNIASLHRYLTSRFASEIEEFLVTNHKIVTP